MSRWFWQLGVLILLLTFAVMPAAKAQGEAVVLPVDGNGIWMRADPATYTPRVTLVKSGETLNLIGRTADGDWVQALTTDGAMGWLMMDFLLAPTVNIPDLPVTVDAWAIPSELGLTPEVIEHVRLIWAKGMLLGNQPRVFAKVGDSITATEFFLASLADRPYYLDDHQALQRVIAWFSAPLSETVNSFNRVSMAAGVGWTTDAAIDAAFADSNQCAEGRTPLECEYDALQPSIALILFGANDMQHLNAVTYERNLGIIIQESLRRGIIPIISTPVPRLGYEAEVERFTYVVHKLGKRFAIPVWEYGEQMAYLSGFGLAPDGIHPTLPAAGYKGAANFSPSNLRYGYVLRNLTALQMLDAVLAAVE